MKKYIAEISFGLGLSIIGFIFSIVLVTSLVFIIGGSVSIVGFIAACLLALGFGYYVIRKIGIPKPILWLIVLSVIIIGCIFLSSQTYDSSYDGDAYHKAAVGTLKNGWNPVYEEASQFNDTLTKYKLVGVGGPSSPLVTSMWSWVDHYPKASWIFAANIYKLTGNIESGKAIAPLMIFAVALIAFAYLYKRLRFNRAAIIAIILAANPIAMRQLFSYYNDGILGNLTIVLVLLLIMYVFNNQEKSIKIPTLFILAGIGMTVILLVNLKFTGLAYAGIIAICYTGYMLFQKDKKPILKIIIVGIVSLIIGLFIVGSSSYVKNTVTDHNPLYPLAGKGKVDIMTEQPTSYVNKSTVYKFLKNNLAPTSQRLADKGDFRPKIPFSIQISEIEALNSPYPDTMFAGYGPWFGGGLILSLLAGVYMLVHYRKTYRKVIALFVLPVVPLLITIVVFSDSWWARYLPQLIIIPVVVLVGLFIVRMKILPYILAFVLLFNTVLLSAITVSFQTTYDKQVRSDISTYVGCDPRHPTEVYSSTLLGTLYDIWDHCDNTQAILKQEFLKSYPQHTVEVYAGTSVVLDH